LPRAIQAMVRFAVIDNFEGIGMSASLSYIIEMTV